jgi:hypothetical protein
MDQRGESTRGISRGEGGRKGGRGKGRRRREERRREGLGLVEWRRLGKGAVEE